MAESTGIAWTSSSWNPWIGCTKVSPGCDGCYAEVSRPAMAMGIKWGAGAPRHRTAASTWKQPLAWNRKAAATGERWTVFPSLCDPFDNEVPDEWRADFWKLINSTPYLTYLLLTKRIGNVAKMLPWGGRLLPWDNVWIGASVVNQEEADRDIPKLLAVPAAKRFVSYEPALGPVDWTRISLGKSPMQVGSSTFRETEFTVNALKGAHSINWPGLSWIIVGGESSQGKHKARPFDLAWARSTVRQCKAAGVPVFVKQFGSNPFETFAPGCDHFLTNLRDRAGADPTEWPEDLRIQQFPE